MWPANITIYLGRHVKCLVFLSDLIKFGMSRHILIRVPSTKFKGNPSSGSHADKRGQTDRHDEASQCFSRLIRWFGAHTPLCFIDSSY
jgi:hypothetical protein